MTSFSRRVSRHAFAGAAAAALLAAGWQSTSAAAPPPAATGHVTRAALKHVDLRIADQQGQYETLLESSGEAKGLPYTITWGTFASGPTIIAALTGGSIDIGPVADVPPIFALAANDPIKLVATQLPRTSEESISGLLVPANSPIKNLKDLKGKKVGYIKGSTLEYFTLTALKSAGLSANDVDLVNLPASGGLAALNSGDVDAWFITDPFLAIGQTENHDRIVVSGSGYVEGATYWAASERALGNRATSAAIADFLSRMKKAQTWANSHLPQWSATYASLTGVSLPEAKKIVARNQSKYVPITSSVVKSEQREANFFLSEGELTHEVDLSRAFDRRYNKLMS